MESRLKCVLAHAAIRCGFHRQGHVDSNGLVWKQPPISWLPPCCTRVPSKSLPRRTAWSTKDSSGALRVETQPRHSSRCLTHSPTAWSTKDSFGSDAKSQRQERTNRLTSKQLPCWFDREADKPTQVQCQLVRVKGRIAPCRAWGEAPAKRTRSNVLPTFLDDATRACSP